MVALETVAFPEISVAENDRKSAEFARQQKARRAEWFNRFEVIARSRFPMNGAVIAEQEAVWKQQFDRQVTDPHAREATTAQAPFANASPTNAFASKFAPVSAKKTSPGRSVRVSVEIDENAAVPAAASQPIAEASSASE